MRGTLNQVCSKKIQPISLHQRGGASGGSQYQGSPSMRAGTKFVFSRKRKNRSRPAPQKGYDHIPRFAPEPRVAEGKVQSVIKGPEATTRAC